MKISKTAVNSKVTKNKGSERNLRERTKKINYRELNNLSNIKLDREESAENIDSENDSSSYNSKKLSKKVFIRRNKKRRKFKESNNLANINKFDKKNKKNFIAEMKKSQINSLLGWDYEEAKLAIGEQCKLIEAASLVDVQFDQYCDRIDGLLVNFPWEKYSFEIFVSVEFIYNS